MKIKTKKQLNLPQLIEWAWENEIKNERFIHSDSNPPEYVWVNENSEIEFDEDMILRKSDLFTVEVKEEITEDTVIPEMLEISLDKERGINLTDIHHNHSINNVKSDSKFGYETLALHVINDDCTHTLIWRDGRLVE